MKRSITTVRKLQLLLAFSVVSAVASAQTEKQISQIKKETNLKTLATFGKQLESKKASVTTLQSQAKKLNIPFSGESNGRLFQLKDIDKKTGLPIYYTTYNKDAAAGTGTNTLNSSSGIFDLDGQDITIHEWDGGGTLITHQEFGGRAQQMDRPTSLSDHATHVAGTMVASGVDGKAKGMAPRARLNAYDWTNDETEMIDAATNAALVSNHSYGYIGGFEYGTWSGNAGWHWFGTDDDTEFKGYGKYYNYDQEWDLITLSAPYYLPVKAAGNPRGGGPTPGGLHYVRINGVWTASNKIRQRNGGEFGFDSVLYGATGKNVLVVGAAHKLNNGYNGADDVRAASFSGFGPTDDGRVKPDIAGIGVDLYSTNSTGVSDYTTMSGTSMASPNVTGSLSLLQQHYRNLNNGTFMKSATLKALIFSTAKEAGNIGPDYKFGWGLLDAHKAAVAISTKNQYSIIEERTLANQATDEIEFVASGNQPIVATIVWDDPVPTRTANTTPLNDRTPMLVNDLDIRVVSDNGTVLPWTLDPAAPNAPAVRGNNIVDNVEQVVIENPEAGRTYRLIVSHKGTLKENQINNNTITLVDANAQNYSVVITGINNGVERDVELVSLKINAEKPEYSTQTPVSAVIRNNGTSPVSPTLNYKLINTDNNTEVATSSVQVSEIQPGEETTVMFNVDLSRAFVNYSIVAEAVIENDSVEANNKNSIAAFGTMIDLTEVDSSHSFNFESDFNANGWTSEDINGDGRTWRKYDGAQFAHSGNSFAINFPNGKGTHDWLYSNPLKMKAGGKYRVIFHTAKLRDGEERLDVAFGKAPNNGAMTNMIAENIIATASYVRKVYTFTPTEDDVYYIGFRNKMNDSETSYAIFLDDVTIDQSEKPIVDFTSSKVNPNTFEAVTLSADTSPNTEIQYQWSFTPDSVSYQEGDSNSPNPKVRFNNQGTYSVTLTATNSKGSTTLSKENYIKVANTAVAANFTTNYTEVYTGGNITFSDTSTGNPAVNQWNWEVSPAEGYAFIQGNKNTQNPTIKFEKVGEYNISLTATSPFSANTITKKIKVLPLNPVRNFKGEADKTTKNVTLTWERPILENIYTEGFEGTNPNVFTIDEDGDNRNWGVTTYTPNVKSGKRGVISYSWNSETRAIDVNNWLVTTLIPKGAEQLSFWVKHDYKELYDVYVVRKENVAGNLPTLQEIKAGTQVYDYTTETAKKTFTNEVVDLKPFANSDIYIAFQHKSRKAQDGFTLALDDIEVGYNTTNSAAAKSQAIIEDDNVLSPGREYIFNESKKENSTEEAIIAPLNTSPAPTLKGYQIFRDNEKIATIGDYNTISFSETVPESKAYQYDILADYGTGVSEKQTVEIDFTVLGISDEALQQDKVMVYPNPSSGPFSVKASKGSKITSLQVFDMSGKSILKTTPNSETYNFDLSKNGKGIYILNTTDTNGKTVNLKIMVK